MSVGWQEARSNMQHVFDESSDYRDGGDAQSEARGRIRESQLRGFGACGDLGELVMQVRQPDTSVVHHDPSVVEGL
jgi:hypothetical protein